MSGARSEVVDYSRPMQLGPPTSGERRAVRPETSAERADRNWNEILQEARVIQTCTQILAGFLLALAFQPRFNELDAYQLGLYLVLVSLAGLATALGLGLVTMHRKLFGKLQKDRVVRIGNRLLLTNLFVVALLAALVTSLIFDFVLNRTAGFIALAIGLVLTYAFWLIRADRRRSVGHVTQR